MQNYIDTAVIASFDAKGNIIPLYFRANNSEPIKITVKSKRNCASSMIFSCEYVIEECSEIKTVTLEYDFGNHIWKILTNLWF